MSINALYIDICMALKSFDVELTVEEGKHLQGIISRAAKGVEQPVGCAEDIAKDVIEGIWNNWYGEHRGNMDAEHMSAVLEKAKQKIINAVRSVDAEMERVKACEHIAEGDMEGNDWRILRNICPSTAAVAALRDKYEALLKRESVNPLENSLTGIYFWDKEANELRFVAPAIYGIEGEKS